MTEHRPIWPTRCVLVLAAVLLPTLSLLGATGPVTAAEVTADCAGAPGSAGDDGGAAFVADSNFTVYYNDSQPMPDSGVFLNDSAMHFRNVTLVANGTASLRLENGTGDATCYGDVNATATPIRIAPADGGTTVLVDGAVGSLSVGPATVDDGNATLAYDASSSWNASITVGEPDGTELEAEDADDGSTFDVRAVEDGTLALTLPAGAHAVALASPPSDSSGSDPPSGGGSDPATETSTLTEVGGGGGGAGGDGTGSSRSTATEATQTPTSTATTTPDTTDEPGDGAVPARRDGDSRLLLGVALSVAVLGAVGAGAWLRFRE